MEKSVSVSQVAEDSDAVMLWPSAGSRAGPGTRQISWSQSGTRAARGGRRCNISQLAAQEPKANSHLPPQVYRNNKPWESIKAHREVGRMGSTKEQDTLTLPEEPEDKYCHFYPYFKLLSSLPSVRITVCRRNLFHLGKPEATQSHDSRLIRPSFLHRVWSS